MPCTFKKRGVTEHYDDANKIKVAKKICEKETDFSLLARSKRINVPLEFIRAANR
jgi:hypothetical protein